jgi:hypothetical protein
MHLPMRRSLSNKRTLCDICGELLTPAEEGAPPRPIGTAEFVWL